MNKMIRTLIQNGKSATIARGAVVRNQGIDPTWSHIIAQPALQ